MTLVDHIEFSALTILIGDGADPEVFTARCSMNASRGFNRTAETNSRNLPDCADDAAPSATLVFVTAKSAEVSGSGVLERADDAFFSTWWASGEAKNVKVVVGDVTDGGNSHSFAAKLTSYNVTGESKDVVNAEITLVSHGAIVTAALA